jgi:L-serine dehydratase
MEEIVRILRTSLEEGSKGTVYRDRILGFQSGRYTEYQDNGLLLGDSLFNRVIASNMVLMEVKSSMGVIVAAPTAGSNATIPGTLFPVSREMNLPNDDLVKAFLAAGLIGVFIAHISTFAAEECGCQAECGSASGMVAAGLVQLKGGSLKQGLDAASFALQNMIGSVCDPVANRVEVPCLGKNIQASLNGIAAANMALAGMDPVIPLDEVIQAMDEAGRSLPRSLRCTGLGGLSITPTSKQLQKKLEDQKNE